MTFEFDASRVVCQSCVLTAKSLLIYIVSLNELVREPSAQTNFIDDRPNVMMIITASVQCRRVSHTSESDAKLKPQIYTNRNNNLYNS